MVAIGVFLALKNIDPYTYYSGWDNVHPEFDLGRYARQVFFGAWLEHQSLGAPAAQGHLSEVARLPILWVLTHVFPANLVRYVFIFAMFIVGGVGMYLYLLKVWLKRPPEFIRPWLASLGGIFYLLHILTLQQFYISFEMFTIQFAFLPFLLLSLHQLVLRPNFKTVLLFFMVQFLIAPSAHTPTIFYLAALFSVAYVGLLAWSQQNFLTGLKMALLVGGFTFAANAHWLLPNLYYSIHDSRYVQESRDNVLFAPESVWSIREAGTLANLTSGMHYLFTWKDYNFETKTYDFIFNEWLPHLSIPAVGWLLKLLGSLTLLGGLVLIFDAKQGAKRWAVLGCYAFCLIFIWIDLFPTSVVFDQLYQVGSFREAFRNPFTKLSVIYSFVSILLFVESIALVSSWLWQRQRNIIFWRGAALSLIFGLMLAIGCTAWPSFTGHFISEKLKVIYPSQYWEMFAYLKTRNRNLRILQLPQQSHAGWEMYDWQFLRKGNGYQGMGFYFFGFPQAYLNRDSDRWIETSDFFYFELKAALDARSSERLLEVVKKYHVDLIIIDQTKVDASNSGSPAADAALISTIGFTPVWQKDFLTIYERTTAEATSNFFVPPQVTLVSADTARVRRDEVYRSVGDYVLTDSSQAQVLFPFANVQQREVWNVTQTADTTTLTAAIPAGTYQAQLPGLQGQWYTTPVALTYKGNQVSVQFPAITLMADETTSLPKLTDFTFTTKTTAGALLVAFNNVGIAVSQGETVYPVLRLAVNSSIEVAYAEKLAEAKFLSSGELDSSQLQFIAATEVTPSWKALQQPLTITISQAKALKLSSTFPVLSLNLLQNPSVNCFNLKTGQIETKSVNGGVQYVADAFAVNCNGYVFSDVSSAADYLLRIRGKNDQGRATKLFVNYADSNVVPEDYLIQKPAFDSFLTLSQVNDDPRSTFFLNWETRSFGKKSVNEMNSMELAPFPLTQFAPLKLQRTGVSVPVVNQAKVANQRRYADVIYVTDYECAAQQCYLGFDQSYDDAWIGWLKNTGFAKHVRLSNWANGWQVHQGNGTLVVVYIPELVSLVCMGLLSVGIGWLVIAFLKQRHKPSEIFALKHHPTNHKLRQQFLGHY